MAEGNTSCSDGNGFWVKASGCQLQEIESQDFVYCDAEILLEALDQELSDSEVRDVLLGSRLEEGGRPSVEAFMHAWLLSLPGVEFVGHVHPVAALAVLCRDGAEGLCRLRYFPDEVVCCGPATAWVPYVDPGLALARAVRQSVSAFVAEFGEAPKVVWLENHGVIGLGRTPGEAESAVLMNDKACRVIASGTGKLRPLTAETVERIRSRPDEHYRQELLFRLQQGRT